MGELTDTARSQLAAGLDPSDAWLARAGAAVAEGLRGAEGPADPAADPADLTDLADLADQVQDRPAWRAAVGALLSVLAAGGGDRPRLAAGSATARLLRAVSGFPGSSAAELRDLCLLDDAAFTAAGGALLAAGLVTDTRFDVPDCWVRTERGRQALARLG